MSLLNEKLCIKTLAHIIRVEDPSRFDPYSDPTFKQVWIRLSENPDLDPTLNSDPVERKNISKIFNPPLPRSFNRISTAHRLSLSVLEERFFL